MKLTVSLSEHESIPTQQDRHYLKSLSGDPAEPVDEAEYLDEVEREAREFFCIDLLIFILVYTFTPVMKLLNASCDESFFPQQSFVFHNPYCLLIN